MAVKMRLRRMGQKKAPFYRIVVSDSRSPRNGKFIEEVGYYDSTKDPSVIKFDEEATKKWLANGNSGLLSWIFHMETLIWEDRGQVLEVWSCFCGT